MICRKCNGSGSLFIRKEYCYCNECFITNVIHKFRACIGKNKSLLPNEKVLICLSGDASSTVLLDLVYKSITLSNHKKLRVIPYFLHVIESDQDKEILSKSVEDQCKRYNFNVIIVDNNEYYTHNVLHNSDGKKSIIQCSDITKNILTKVPISTSQDVITKIKQNIFIKVAKELNCSIIFTAETTTLLASRLLSNIAIGRGSQVENDIGFADNRDGNVKILRPMRDITAEEIDHYITIKELKPAYTKSVKPYGSSIQSVIRNFVMDLQENYPATISTVCKTADKIASTNNDANQNKCGLCQSNMAFKNTNLTAVEATMFSRKVSLRQSEESSYSENLQTLDNDSNLMFPLIFESLCYCCSRNISELDDPITQALIFKNKEN